MATSSKFEYKVIDLACDCTSCNLLLNACGADGWELVSVAVVMNGLLISGHRAFMKRLVNK